jgi:filamin
LDGIKITDNNDGTYLVKYTPVEIGKTQIQVQLQGKHISNSPKIIPVSKDQPDPLQCLCYGPGLEKAIVGEKAPFTIEAKNKHGKSLTTGGDPFEVFVKGPYDSDIPATVVDNKNGTYAVHYVPTDKGKHQVKVLLKGAHVAKSPYDVMAYPNPREPDAMKTVAYGPGIDPKGENNTNEPSNFTVELRNANGEKVRPPPGPCIIDCFVTDPRGNDVDDVKIKDNGDGTLQVQYHAKEAGPHLIEVVLRNPHKPHYYDHIQGSPFRVDVAPGIDAEQCIAYGPGLEDGVEDTIPTHFTIEARDGRGNKIHKGGDPFVVKINGPGGPVPCTVKDNGDGTYRVDYKANEGGPHKIAVTLKDRHIKGSAFDVNVREGADERFTIIESYSFVIRAKTKKNNNKKTGGDNIKVNINGRRGPVKDVKLSDNKDGTYTANFALPESGDYQVNVLLNEKDIKSSPFNITAK